MEASAPQQQTPPANLGNANAYYQPCVYKLQTKDDETIVETGGQSMKDYLIDFSGVKNFHYGE